MEKLINVLVQYGLGLLHVSMAKVLYKDTFCLQSNSLMSMRSKHINSVGFTYIKPLFYKIKYFLGLARNLLQHT